MKSYTDITNPNLARVLAHPLRVQILGVLDERIASPSEIARELEAPLGTVSYHVNQLKSADFIELVRTAQRRGALEHYYRATLRPRITDEVWAELPELVKQALTGSALASISARVNSAALAGGFSRTDAQLSKTELTLDERGWSAVVREIKRLDERIERIQTDSAARLGNKHEDEIAASLVLLYFQPAPVVAPPRTRAPSRRTRARARTATPRD